MRFHIFLLFTTTFHYSAVGIIIFIYFSSVLSLATPHPFSQNTHCFFQVDAHVTNLTGRPFSSYITLHGTHIITGNTTFLGVVRAPVVEATSGYVDGLLVSNATVLTTTGQQQYLGMEVCGKKNAEMQKIIRDKIPAQTN